MTKEQIKLLSTATAHLDTAKELIALAQAMLADTEYNTKRLYDAYFDVCALAHIISEDIENAE